LELLDVVEDHHGDDIVEEAILEVEVVRGRDGEPDQAGALLVERRLHVLQDLLRGVDRPDRAPLGQPARKEGDVDPEPRPHVEDLQLLATGHAPPKLAPDFLPVSVEVRVAGRDDHLPSLVVEQERLGPPARLPGLGFTTFLAAGGYPASAKTFR